MTKAEKAQAITDKYTKAMNETDGPLSGLHVQWMTEMGAMHHDDKAFKHMSELAAKAHQCQQDGIKLVVIMPDGTEKQIAPLCDCLIDQNCFIGDDPIGHACNNLSKYHYYGINVCEDCMKMLGNPKQMQRVTIPKVLLIEATERLRKGTPMTKAEALQKIERDFDSSVFGEGRVSPCYMPHSDCFSVSYVFYPKLKPGVMDGNFIPIPIQPDPYQAQMFFLSLGISGAACAFMPKREGIIAMMMGEVRGFKKDCIAHVMAMSDEELDKYQTCKWSEV